MMLGSGGMTHGSQGGGHAQAARMEGQTLIRDTVVKGLRVTAEFPPYALGDALAYRATVRRAGDSTAVTDAPVTMFIGRDDTRDHTMQVSPSALGDGTYVFRPVISSEGAYRVVIRVERAGDTMSTPAIELEQVVHLATRMDMATQVPKGGAISSWAPTALLGAGVMAVMMLVMLR